MSTRNVNSYKSFVEWFYENIDLESMRTLRDYGASAGVAGLIYCSETTALFNAFKDEIEEIATGNYETELWQIAKRCDSRSITQLVNTLVWEAAERLARGNGAYLDELMDEEKSLKAAFGAEGDANEN
jgi:hypothetical protein